jgi:hypothetical protein
MKAKTPHLIRSEMAAPVKSVSRILKLRPVAAGMLGYVQHTEEENGMQGKCPKCEVVPHIMIVPLRARDEVSKTTVPILQFLCDQCCTILSIALDPEWQAQVVAGQLRTVGERSDTSH